MGPSTLLSIWQPTRQTLAQLTESRPTPEERRCLAAALPPWGDLRELGWPFSIVMARWIRILFLPRAFVHGARAYCRMDVFWLLGDMRFSASRQTAAGSMLYRLRVAPT